jgi:hypothetical protein
MWVQNWLDGSELTWVPEPPCLNNVEGASSLECTVEVKEVVAKNRQNLS